MLSTAMFRLLLLGVALALFVPSGLGRATTTQNNTEIVAIDLAGRETNLTHNPAFDVNPAVARDGRIAFFSTRDGGDLYVMDSDGRNVRRLTNGAVDHSDLEFGDDLEWSQASWSPRGDKIAFDGKYMGEASPPCEQHCADLDVLVVGSDGNGLKQVALRARAPAWSPGGRLLAYESSVDGYYEAGSVTTSRPDGSGPVETKAINGVSSIGPVWSPRGGEIAFQAARGARSWIYLVRADGTRKRPLASGNSPTWSPDGRRLAFVDNCALITINKDGTGRQRLSPKGESVTAAAWSPKGSTLAYLARPRADDCVGLPSKLETVNPEGKHLHKLARWPASSLVWGKPVWTVDGKRILVAGPAR
jgi:Tol biopolymer transport system component